MSKANQKFVQADDAVSPVIGVILMVAITVVLAAVVFVLVSNLSKGTGDKGEDASVTISSPQANRIYITAVKVGQNGPYALTDFVITVTNVTASTTKSCTNALGPIPSGSYNATDYLNDAGSVPDGKWGAGETVVMLGDCSAAGSTAGLVSGSSYLVSVSVHGTLLVDNTKIVIA